MTWLVLVAVAFGLWLVGRVAWRWLRLLGLFVVWSVVVVVRVGVVVAGLVTWWVGGSLWCLGEAVDFCGGAWCRFRTLGLRRGPSGGER